MCTAMKQNLYSMYKAGSRQFFNFSQKKFDLGVCNIVELGNVSAELPVPDHIEKPFYYYEPIVHPVPGTPLHPEIKSIKDVNQMKLSCKLAATILRNCRQIIKPGITTNDIDVFVHHEAIAANAYPSPLRYFGFPKSVCTSVNNVACHGIPDDRKLLDGDIVHVDVTVFFNGFHGDCSYTYEVGQVDERGQFLIEKTKLCVDRAIGLCAPNRQLCSIGRFIENFAKTNGLDVVPAFVGHGIGKYFHGPPEILHYDNSLEGLMLPGMTFTIEPILTLGDREIEVQEDGWTAMTLDNSRSASFEHTILITDSGVEILTE